jgi:hypothetical protein
MVVHCRLCASPCCCALVQDVAGYLWLLVIAYGPQATIVGRCAMMAGVAWRLF